MKFTTQDDYKATILTVDDNPSVLEIIQRGLTRRNYCVITVQGGDKSIDLMKTITPDLILCDISMPRMGGHEVLQIVKATPALSEIPFIFLTALGDHESIRQGLDMGASDYMGKPFKIKELTHMIEQYLAPVPVYEANLNYKNSIDKSIFF